MKKVMLALLCLPALAFAGARPPPLINTFHPLPANPDITIPDTRTLTEQQALACEAWQCLSSDIGSGIPGCQPSRQAFFRLKAATMTETLKQRRDFLNHCPVDVVGDKAALLESLVNIDAN